MADFTKWEEKLRKLEDYLQNDIQIRIGKESVDHFKESFINQGFTDQSLEKWDDVKRREVESPWYGFKYKGTAKNPRRKQRKKGGYTHYSPAATTRQILSGETGNLMNGIRWRKNGRGVEITASTKYAQLINEGGQMKVFGKHITTMPQRQFMGKSRALNKKIEVKIIKDLKRIMR